MGIAHGIYTKAETGAISGCVAGVSGAPALEDFRDVVAEFLALEGDGLIEITELHRESHTGHRYCDLVRFRKLR